MRAKPFVCRQLVPAVPLYRRASAVLADDNPAGMAVPALTEAEQEHLDRAFDNGWALTVDEIASRFADHTADQLEELFRTS